MKTVFADTYYFLAIGNDQDEGHQRARQYAAGSTDRILTTEWVLTEVADALAAPTRRNEFLTLLKLIEDDENWFVIEFSHDLFKRGIELFSRRPDKARSLTDCISFVVMQEHGLSEALTADHHFEQAGYTLLLQ